MADLNESNRIIQKAIDQLRKSMNAVEPRFANLVIEWVKKFDSSNGNIGNTKRNNQKVAGIKKQLDKFLLESGYNRVVSNFISNYDPLTAQIKEVHKDLNEIEINRTTKRFTSKDLNDYKRAAAKTTVDNMRGQGLNTALTNPLQRNLLLAVQNNASLSDTIKSLEIFLKTTDKSQGQLKKVSIQASRDALGQYEGAVNEKIATVYKLDALLYIGSLIKDSRPQCERWVNYRKHGKKGLILRSELDDQIQWANNNGTGWIEETTESTFCENRGGFNCRHTCYPVRSSVYIKE